MTIYEAIILGLVQGLAEFLPISSSGHLALLQHFFGIEGESVVVFAVLLHLGTLISVFIVYARDIWELCLEFIELLKDLAAGRGFGFGKNETRRLGFMIIVATIPTAFIGIFFNDLFKSFYTNLIPIGVGLILTGSILIISERIGKGNLQISEMKFRHAVFVGICQGIAIAPGVSRSGSTLFGSLISGIKRETAVKFAFLISIPSILGSVVFEIPRAFEAGVVDGQWIFPILIGMIMAALSGLIAIKTMIAFVAKQKLIYFSIYTWLLGIGVIVYSLGAF